MRMTAKNLNELKKKLEVAVNEALKQEVTDAIRNEQIEQIQALVYGAYPEPKVYERRYGNGGLMDGDNINGVVVNGRLVVSNDTPPNPNARDGATTDKNLIEVIETGVGYDYSPNPGARPFINATVIALESSNAVGNALKSGLKRQGLKVK